MKIIQHVFVKAIPAVVSGLDGETMKSVESVDSPGTAQFWKVLWDWKARQQFQEAVWIQHMSVKGRN